MYDLFNIFSMTETCAIPKAVEADEGENDYLFVDSEDDDEEYYEKLVDDSLSKKKRRNFRKSINSSDSSTRTWNIDKTRQNLLKRLTLLPLGKRSFEVLSKFVINHQILEIVKVLKFGSCLEVHVKLNLKKQNVSELETYNSVVKVFQHQKNLRPDLEAAKKFKEALDGKNKNNPNANQLQQSNGKALRIENIVFIKMIGDEELPLLQMINANPKKLRGYFEDILGKMTGNKNVPNWKFMKKTTPKDILWYKSQWMVVCNVINHTPRTDEQFCYVVNLYSIAKVFDHFGLAGEELVRSYSNSLAKYERNTFCHRYDRDVSVIVRINDGSFEVFTKHRSSKNVTKILEFNSCSG